MFHIVCYDISDDSARNRMSETLLDFGARIQESVFECVLEAGDLKRMLERLARIEIADTDKVRIYSLCTRCLDATRIYGPGTVTADPEFYLL